MKRSAGLRAPWLVWSAAVLCLVLMVSATHWSQQRELREHTEQAAGSLERYLRGSIAAINRGLLTADAAIVTQAAALKRMGDIQEASKLAELAQRLREAVDQTLLAHDVMLIGADGRVLAAAREATQRLGHSMPNDFVVQLAQADQPGLRISAPAINEATGEASIWLARKQDDVQGSPTLVVEMQISVLADLMVQGAIGEGWEAMVESREGRVLAAFPAAGRDLGSLLPRALGVEELDGRARPGSLRREGQPGLIAGQASI